MSNTQYDDIADAYSNMTNPTKKYVLIPTFQKLISNVNGKTVLDLACGSGYFTRILASYNPKELLGIDISEQLIAKAIEKEKHDQLGITYKTADVLRLRLDKKYALITAVYLLNYAKSTDELLLMCKNIYNHLSESGTFSSITTNSDLKPMSEFEYKRRYTNLNNSDSFKDGDKIKIEIKEDNKPKFEFICYYWSKDTYRICLKNAGFKSIEWIEPVISQEAIKKTGDDYWTNYRNNPTFIGIKCKK